MAISTVTKDSEMRRHLLQHINEQLDRGFKIALPEWDKIDAQIAVKNDPITGRLHMRIDFLFDPNGLSKHR